MSATTNRQAVLHALQAAGPEGCLTAQLCHPDCGAERFGARIEELRKEGWQIKSRYHRVGSWRYTLIGRAEAAPTVIRSARSALGSFHACERCGFTFRGSWPRECPSCHAGCLWLASFHTRVACAAHEPIALVGMEVAA